MEILQECNDVGVSGTSPLLRRCFENKYFLEFYNDGSTIAEDVQLAVSLDEHFEFVSSDMETGTSTGLEFVFDIGDIRPKQAIRHHIKFVLSCEADLGQRHYLSTEVLYGNACPLQLRQDTSFLCIENRGSYDPNDKTIFLNGFANESVIGENNDLEYLIPVSYTHLTLPTKA